MTVFVDDIFSEGADTELSLHTPGTGGAWAKQTGSTNDGEVIAAEDRFHGLSTSVNALYNNDAVPGTAEYDVGATLRLATDDTNQRPGILGRASDSAHTFYQAVLDDTTDGWTLDKLVAGTQTNLGTWVTTPVANTSYTAKLEIRDATKKLFVDGTQRISSTDNAITAAGRAGLRSRLQGRVDNFLATDLATEGQPTMRRWGGTPAMSPGGARTGRGW